MAPSQSDPSQKKKPKITYIVNPKPYLFIHLHPTPPSRSALRRGALSDLMDSGAKPSDGSRANGSDSGAAGGVMMRFGSGVLEDLLPAIDEDVLGAEDLFDLQVGACVLVWVPACMFVVAWWMGRAGSLRGREDAGGVRGVVSGPHPSVSLQS